MTDDDTGRSTPLGTDNRCGKRDGFTLEDFRECGRVVGLKRGRAEAILGQVCEAVSRWPEFAAQAGVAEQWMEQIRRQLRLDLI